jgi:hypothetical protein
VARYYFDLLEGDEFIPDREGIEFDCLNDAQIEATSSVADLAREALREKPNCTDYRTVVEVRNESGTVLQAKLTFQIEKK